ncbi:MAG: type II toxin-antitoxin system RelE/ParE family toxin [Thermoguttaceae bacterium]
MFRIGYAEGVADDLSGIRPYERQRLLDQIDQQLEHEPTRETRNRKPLRGLVPPWEHIEPVWELRAGDYRVFYDVNEASRQVIVRAVRRKRPHQSTEDIL